MKGKWPDLLFTLAVRFVVGAIISILVSIPVTFFAGSRGPGRRRSLLVEWVQAGHYGVLVLWFGAWGLAGGLIAALTIPRWQTPWHKPERWNLKEDNDDIHVV